MISALCWTLLLSCARGDDWPQWQGPDRNAISKEGGLLKEWPKEGPPLTWKITGLGGGYGSPAIAAGRIFGMSTRGGDEVVWALSEKDGKELWASRVVPALHQQMPQAKEGPACTPTVDGELLYVEGLGGDVACLQVKDGKIVWQHSLTHDFGGRVPAWSYRESPLVDGEKVIVTPGAQDAMLVALDKATGKTIWKCQMPADSGGSPTGPAGGPGGPGGFGGMGGSGAAYASAIAIDANGQRQYVQMTAKALVGVAASDGKLLWRYDRPANGMGLNCTTPIYHDGMVFDASAYGAGGGLAKLSQAADGGITAQEIYATKKMQNHHGGMILLDGCLYGANGGNDGGYLICLDFLTGNVLWDERDDPMHRAPKGALALADGRLYYRTEKGTLLLIERGRFEQPDRSPQPAWAHPVIANGKLYVPDQDSLFCYDIKAK
jgi:outer membrane protein assembly factor BamB